MKKITNEKLLRDKILCEIKRYHDRFQSGERFIPGVSRVPYAGRIFDHRERQGIVESALDFWLTEGRMSAELEGAFKNYFKTERFLLVNSGSSANLLLIASITSRMFEGSLKPGDEIITPPVTFPTTVGPIVQYGLVPVFVDAKVGTYNINEDLIEKAAAKRTKAVFIPHTLGNPCDMDKIMEAARRKKLIVLEDACDALGSKYDKKRVGTFGRMASLSFYPAHHMTMGEGGGVVINDKSLIRPALSIRDWGRDCYCRTGHSGTCGRRFSMKLGDLPLGYDHKYIYSNIGYNLKATEMQSAVGLAQFDKLSEFEKIRRRNFNFYYKALSKLSRYLIMPRAHDKSDPSWFGFPITVKKGVSRLNLIKYLEDSKIETRLLFGGNIVRQPAFRNIKARIAGPLTEADEIMNNSFFIGVYPGITPEMTEYVVNRFNKYLCGK